MIWSAFYDVVFVFIVLVALSSLSSSSLSLSHTLSLDEILERLCVCLPCKTPQNLLKALTKLPTLNKSKENTCEIAKATIRP